MSEQPFQSTLPGIPDIPVFPGPAPDSSGGLPVGRWLEEGLRAGFFRAPRVAGYAPAPWQAISLALLVLLLEAAASRLQIDGPARFSVQAWLSGWWTLVAFIGLAWWAFPAKANSDLPAVPGSPGLAGVATCFVLWLLASLPNTLLYEGLTAAIVHGWVKGRVFSTPWLYWGLYLAFTAWSLGVSFFLMVRFAGRTWRAAVFALALIATMGLTAWQFEARAWEPDPARNAAAADDKPRLHLSQQTLEMQQALWQRTMAAIAPERPGVADVYGLVFAPYASEDVFLRESTLVSRVLAERFDAAGRVVHLLNHGSTAATHPWATPLNLQRAIDVLAQRMDRDKDVLVVYLTSHGARDFKLAASHWPLEVEALSPSVLREALDKAGIRNRVIAVSACYSGGWVDVLANDNTLVMTAADATHTSYGCGRLSELTFFGRALFDEQLRKTHSFEQAFARAVPLIKQREIDAGKEDGFSNPQIRVGANIGPVLRALEQRLAALPQAIMPAGTPSQADADKTRP
ncbi:MAG: C13 family peptidase [Polaromonas sp.]|uniref:C13 family peptidase n=1 Tax=Polaromonas sp. TaxID=1869339 RepID=UPI0027345CBD|nr:C13 family peptidase [Polaromonas sp.]MDP3798822.1 C13 family peptidase [Polaromonas sp.]